MTPSLMFIDSWCAWPVVVTSPEWCPTSVAGWQLQPGVQWAHGGPNHRWYAALPLFGSTGHVLFSFCKAGVFCLCYVLLLLCIVFSLPCKFACLVVFLLIYSSVTFCCDEWLPTALLCQDTPGCWLWRLIIWDTIGHQNCEHIDIYQLRT